MPNQLDNLSYPLPLKIYLKAITIYNLTQTSKLGMYLWTARKKRTFKILLVCSVWQFTQLLLRFWLTWWWGLMDAGHSASKSKEEHQVGRQAAWKSSRAIMSIMHHYHQQISIFCHLSCCSFPRICSPTKNGIGQTSKLEGINNELTQKALEANLAGAGLLRPSCCLMW